MGFPPMPRPPHPQCPDLLGVRGLLFIKGVFGMFDGLRHLGPGPKKPVLSAHQKRTRFYPRIRKMDPIELEGAIPLLRGLGPHHHPSTCSHYL